MNSIEAICKSMKGVSKSSCAMASKTPLETKNVTCWQFYIPCMRPYEQVEPRRWNCHVKVFSHTTHRKLTQRTKGKNPFPEWTLDVDPSLNVLHSYPTQDWSHSTYDLSNKVIRYPRNGDNQSWNLKFQSLFVFFSNLRTKQQPPWLQSVCSSLRASAQMPMIWLWSSVDALPPGLQSA